MSDLIERERTKDAVDCMLALLRVPQDMREEAIDLFINRIPNAEPRVGEWIPCEERMPKAFENPVLVSGYKGYVSLGWWNGKEFETATRLPHVDVIAWQPLPEPYEMERSE